MSGQPPKSVFSTLIVANHILHYHNVVDAFGHISVRNPANPSTFFISGSRAPALVSGLSDLVEYNVEDASPVHEGAPKGYAERFIHSEIYKAYGEVNSVVHGHAEVVIPFSITSQPIRSVYHMAGVIGPQIPVFDISNHYQASDTAHSMLVTNQHLGAGLASAFAPKSLVSSIKSYFSSTTAAPVSFPPFVTALMRGHGFTCVGRSIEESVYRSIFLCANARIQTTAIMMQNAFDNQSFMTQKTGQDKQQFTPGSVHYLSGRESADAWNAMQASVERPWKLWCAEVEKSELYENTLGPPPGA